MKTPSYARRAKVNCPTAHRHPRSTAWRHRVQPRYLRTVSRA